MPGLGSIPDEGMPKLSSARTAASGPVGAEPCGGAACGRDARDRESLSVSGPVTRLPAAGAMRAGSVATQPAERCRAASTACPRAYSEREKAGPGAEAPGSVARRAHAPEDYAARRISMPTLSLAFRVLVRCPEQGLPAPNRSSPYRKSHLTLPKQDRTRDPFTVQSNLFRPQQKHPGSALSATPDARPDPRSVSGAGCFWWRRRVPPPGPEALL